MLYNILGVIDITSLTGRHVESECEPPFLSNVGKGSFLLDDVFTYSFTIEKKELTVGLPIVQGYPFHALTLEFFTSVCIYFALKWIKPSLNDMNLLFKNEEWKGYERTTNVPFSCKVGPSYHFCPLGRCHIKQQQCHTSPLWDDVVSVVE